MVLRGDWREDESFHPPFSYANELVAYIHDWNLHVVPSAGGISHNPAEYTAPEQIRAGADVLLRVVLEKAMK